MGGVHAFARFAAWVTAAVAARFAGRRGRRPGARFAGRRGARVAARAGAGLAVLGLAAGVVACAPPARAADVFVEVNPNTVQAGFQVQIRASCGDSLNPAVVRSEAFGQVTLLPENGFLTATVVIPPDTRPREYRVRLSCPNGSAATTTLVVLSMGRPTLGPATGGGGTAGGRGGRLMIAGGLAVLGVGTGLGLLVLHRRKADRPV